MAIRFFKVLAYAGANLDLQDKVEFTTLMKAVQSGRVEVNIASSIRAPTWTFERSAGL
jgi:hypothetical protein